MTMTMCLPVDCYIGLGSNLGDPKAQLEQAIVQLRSLANTRFIKHSTFYQTKPLGPQDQPDFLNAVAKLSTRLGPQDLLTLLQHIEDNQKRVRTRRWGARTLDLDLLLYGDQTLNTPRLIVPHPHLLERDFVLRPLFEIAPDLRLPNGQWLRQIIAQRQSV